MGDTFILDSIHVIIHYIFPVISGVHVIGGNSKFGRSSVSIIRRKEGRRRQINTKNMRM
jgi:hypothetical protein